jgi:DNA-binding MarR family transcriptional regulator
MRSREPDELAVALHAVAIRLLRRLRSEDVATGVSGPRLSVLSVLVFGGAHTVTQLAEAEQVAVPTMTRLLQALEGEGYVRRCRDAHDGRIVRVTATARGRRVLEAGRRARLARLEALLKRVPASGRAELRRAVTLLEQALAAEVPQRGGA